jgi:hypothetical protein
MDATIAIQVRLTKRTFAALQKAAALAQSTEAEVASAAIEMYLQKLAGFDPLLGLFADETALIDEITGEAMHSREHATWRLSEGNDGQSRS